MTPEDLVGYPAEKFPFDAGYFYTPYVPMTQTPIVLDPDAFDSTKGILTKYGKKILEQGAIHYGKKSSKEYRSIDEPFESSKID